MQKTIRGKKCPKCSSFIKADQDKCTVCGFEFDTNDEIVKETELPVTVKTEGDSIICPKCDTQNNAEFKFCKICKYPLKDAAFYKNKSGKKLQLRFEWLRNDVEEFLKKEQDFDDFLPYFDGCLVWQGYAFCVYKNGNRYEILSKKSDPDVDSILYKKYSQAFIEDSGKEFFLGAVKIKVLGDVNSRMEIKTIVSSDKTIFAGPGESLDDKSAKTGLPRLRILDMGLKEDMIEIGEKVLFGRDFLSRHTDLDYEVMRKSGVSNEHVYLTPIQGAKWLIEPLPDKPIFTEISAVPVILYNGDILRWVSSHFVGEFKITIKETEV